WSSDVCSSDLDMSCPHFFRACEFRRTPEEPGSSPASTGESGGAGRFRSDRQHRRFTTPYKNAGTTCRAPTQKRVEACSEACELSARGLPGLRAAGRPEKVETAQVLCPANT